MYNKDGQVELNRRTDDDFTGYARNYTAVWQKFPRYSEENTLMVSNYLNQFEEYHRNDFILPLYHPKYGKTDVLDDKHLIWSY